MIQSIIHLYTVGIYQPFLNLLVFIYWVILHIPNIPHDMGIAVIIFTLAVRCIMLPLSLHGSSKEVDRRELMRKLDELKKQFAYDPVGYRAANKKLMKAHSSLLSAEGLDLLIQAIIILMCWRIFATGLEGADLYLIYPWMPKVPQPFNLVFLGKIYLGAPNILLNVLQAVGVFVLEGIHLLSSAYPVTREEVIQLQFFLPVVSYIYFSFMPSGKKLFMVTTVAFSIVLSVIKIIVRFFRTFGRPVIDSTPTSVETPPISSEQPTNSTQT